MNRYLVAVLVTAAAVALRLAPIESLGLTPHSSVVLFIGAAVTAAWYGGFRAGLLSTALGTLALDFLFIEPRFSLAVERADDRAALLSLAVAGLVGCWLRAITLYDPPPTRFGNKAPPRRVGTTTPGPPDPSGTKMTPPGFWWLGCFVVANLVAAGAGQGLKLIPGVEITFWPPSGIFVAALLLNDRRKWPWWVAGAGVAELVGNALWFHNPLHLAVLYFAANAGTAMTAACLVRRSVGGASRVVSLHRLEAPRNAALFAILAGGVAPVVSATVIATADAIIGKHTFRDTWLLVWLGDGTGLLLSAPLTLAAAHTWRHRGRIRVEKTVEFAGTCGLTLVLSWLALRGYLPTVYVVLPTVVWAAVRFQLRGAWAVLTAVVLAVAVGTRSDLGEFAGPPDQMRHQVVALQAFLGVCALTALIVAGLSTQHVRALARLRAANLSLEQRILDRTAALRESEGRFRLAADAVNGIIYECDFATGHVERTRGVYEVLGYRPEDVPPTEAWWVDQIHPEDRTRVAEVDPSAVRADNAPVEYRLRHKDGRWLHVEDRAVLVRDDGGRPVKMIGCTVDVTTRKEAEAALRTSEVRYRRLFESAKDGILILDADTATITDANPFIGELLGYSPDELAGKELWQIGLFRDAAASQAAVRELQATGYIRYDDLPLETKAGRRVSVEFVSNVYGEDGHAVIQCNVRDISVRKRLEESMRQHAADLSEADRRKDEFLATLAHELRNPLAPIQNGVQIIKMTGADGAVGRSLDMMDRQLGHLVRLIDDLLDVSRITQGKLHLRRERVALSAVVEAAVETVLPLVAKNGHELTVMPVPAAWLDGDPTRLSQVFSNLLTNSAKYTERGGRITLAAKVSGGEAVVSVRDTGIGIPPAMLTRVFEMFGQVDRALEKTTGGLGIGLSLVRGLVEMHGGTVSAHSGGEGKGSEFTVRLPATAGDTGEGQAMNGTTLKATGRKLTVLVVDDNEDAAESMATMLEMYGHEVRTAFDGEAGVREAGAFRPQVAFLDLGMPKLNGYDAARRVRTEEWGKAVVLVALTGWGSDDDRRKSEEAGFDHHLTKPVNPQALVKLLAELEVATA